MKTSNFPSPHEILFLRGDINYTEFHLVNGRKVVSSFTLLRHQEKLDGFLRVSRKHLVNPQQIKKVSKEEGKKSLIMRNGALISVSRRRQQVIN